MPTSVLPISAQTERPSSVPGVVSLAQEAYVILCGYFLPSQPTAILCVHLQHVGLSCWPCHVHATVVSDHQDSIMHFQRLSLSKALLRALAEEGYEHPTPVQQQAIVANLSSK